MRERISGDTTLSMAAISAVSAWCLWARRRSVQRTTERTSSTCPTRKWAAWVIRRWRERLRSWSRRSAEAPTTTASIWLMVWVRAWMAERRAMRRIRSCSTQSSPAFGVMSDVPANTARAAASASMVSDFPRSLRSLRLGPRISTTELPAPAGNAPGRRHTIRCPRRHTEPAVPVTAPIGGDRCSPSPRWRRSGDREVGRAHRWRRPRARLCGCPPPR